MTQLVLVHGFMGGSAQWQGYVETLGAKFDVIAVDLPGFGGNAHLPAIASIGGYADWVIQHLHSLGVQKYHLLGHSMGGMITQEIALRDTARVDRLVLYATGSVGVLPGRFETIQESKSRAEQDGPAPTARRIAATWFLKREAAEGYANCAAIAAQTKLDAIHAGLEAMQSWSGAHNLSNIQQNTLILWGDQDRTYQWAQIQTLWHSIPNAALAVLPHCAHAVHAEKPALFQSLIADFLDH